MSRYGTLFIVILILSFPVCTWLIGAALVASTGYHTEEPRDVSFWIMAPLLIGVFPATVVFLVALILLLFCTAPTATVIRGSIDPLYAANPSNHIVVIVPQREEERESLTNEEFVEQFQLPQSALTGLKIIQEKREYMDPRKA